MGRNAKRAEPEDLPIRVLYNYKPSGKKVFIISALIKVLSGIAFFLLSTLLCGQDAPLTDSVEQVIIRASRIDIQASKRKVKLEPGLVKSLIHESPIQLQSNGPGYLSTALIHGFGARHTALIWNDFNIQSPLNGTYDLSLINGFENVVYTPKSISASVGTASLAGAIIIDNPMRANQSVADISLTDTNNFRVKLSHNFNVRKLISQVAIHNVNNQNKFNYRFDGEKQRWNSKFDGRDLHWTSSYAINTKLSLEGKMWLQSYSRDVPGSLVTNIAVANQTDKNDRYHLKAIYVADEMAINIAYAHFTETLNFETVGIDSRANNKTNAINLTGEYGDHKLNLSHRNDVTNSNFYNDIISRNLSLFSYRNFKQWNKSISSTIVISKQLQDSDWSPLLFDLQLRHESATLDLNLSVNSAYNTPTLNDLYWPQGGNADLLPEEAIGVDLDMKFRLSSKSSIAVSPYYKKVSNWVLWTPGDQFWSPKNQRKVVSKGFDGIVDFQWNRQLNSVFQFSYTDATIVEDINFSNVLGNQLIYVPRVKSSLSLDYSYQGIRLIPKVLFISKRFLSTDNRSSLPSYSIVDLSLSKEIKFAKNRELTLGLSAHNLFNTDYQQIRFYPMPLRYFSINLKFKTVNK